MVSKFSFLGRPFRSSSTVCTLPCLGGLGVLNMLLRPHDVLWRHEDIARLKIQCGTDSITDLWTSLECTGITVISRPVNFSSIMVLTSIETTDMWLCRGCVQRVWVLVQVLQIWSGDESNFCPLRRPCWPDGF